jgi:carboxyl-terminal processing protease
LWHSEETMEKIEVEKNPTKVTVPDGVQRSAYVSKLLGALLLVMIGLGLGRYIVPAGATPVNDAQFEGIQEGQRQIVFPTFWEAWDTLHNKYIGEIDQQDLFYGSVSGMVKAAGDPYTVFSDPQDTKQFEETIEGSFSGIGVEIGIRGGALTVIAPLEGSPAQEAGIREGDIVVAVDEEPITVDMTLDDAVSRIRGKRGTEVVLTVIRKDAQTTEDITVRRDIIDIESVKLNIEDAVAHVNISSFNGDTSAQFTKAARQIVSSQAKGIILDVRNNPGGYLQTSVEIASRFLPEEMLVVSERGQKTTEYKAEGNTLLQGIPMVILVNEGSASASEILAGALRDQQQIPLIGTKTFGKGSVQELIKLSDGSSIRVTVAKWYTPSGHNIHENGLEPDIEVEQNYDTEEDEPLIKAKEELQKRIDG